MTSFEKTYRETLGRDATPPEQSDPDPLPVIRQAKPPGSKRGKKYVEKPQRQINNAAKPGEERLRDWIKSESLRSGKALRTIKSYASRGYYAAQWTLREVNERVKFVKPIPGAPLPVYNPMGRPSKGLREKDKVRLCRKTTKGEIYGS